MKFVRNPRMLVPEYHIIPALIGAGVALGSMAVNAYSQYKTNKQNASAQQQNLDYQKSVQQQTWQREDTAYQRAVNDAKNAGLSPLAVSGGAATSTPISTTAPQSTAMNVDASQVAQSAQAIAQQRIATKQLQLQNKSLEEDVKQKQIENAMRTEEFKESQLQSKRDYDLRYNAFEHQSGLDLRRLARDIANDNEQTRQFNARLNLDSIRHDFEKSTWQKDFERRGTQWEDEMDMRRTSQYFQNQKTAADTEYQRKINEYFKNDKTLSMLFRALALMK